MALNTKDVAFWYFGPGYTVANLRAAPHDTLVIDRSTNFALPNDGDFTAADLNTIRFGQATPDGGQEHNVLLYMSLAEIDVGRTVYGQLVGVATLPHPSAANVRMVDFTDPDWATFLINTWLPNLIDQNSDMIADADGLFLDTVDAYRAFAANGANWWGALGSQQALADAMIALLAQFIPAAKAYAAARGEADFKIFLGHAPQLFAHASNSPAVEANKAIIRAHTDAVLLEAQYSGAYVNGEATITPVPFADGNIAQVKQDFGAFGIDIVSTSTFSDAGLAEAFNRAMLSEGFFGYARPSNAMNSLGPSSNRATAGDDVLLASHSGAYLVGLGGADLLLGANGADTLDGAAGADTMRAGAGNDLVIAEGADSADGGAGNDVMFATLTGATLLGGDGNDILRTYHGGSVLRGGAGNDTLLEGSGGASILDGGDGNDVLWIGSDTTIQGGAGFDYAIDYSFGPFSRQLAGLGLEVFVANGSARVIDARGAGYMLVYGDYRNDTITLDDAGGYAFGGSGGSDTLIGGAGTDFLIGGRNDFSGGDNLIGGDGADLLYIDQGDLFSGGAGVDYAIVETTDAIIASLTGAGVEVFISNAGADTINAAGAATPVGLYGGPGNDYLLGPNFASQYFGEAGNDTLAAGISNDVLLGGDGADLILASLGGDMLLGELGADTLEGGLGDDVLWGGLGDDEFRFSILELVPGGNDVIADFGDIFADNDVIRLNGVAASQVSFRDIFSGTEIRIALAFGVHTIAVYSATPFIVQDDILYG